MTPEQLEQGALAIRDAVKVYRALTAVADMLGSLGPIEETVSSLNARAVELRAEIARLEQAQTEAAKKAAIAQGEYERNLARNARDFEARMKAEDVQIEAMLAERKGQLAELTRSVENQEIHLRKITDEITRLRALFA